MKQRKVSEAASAKTKSKIYNVRWRGGSRRTRWW